MEEKIADNESQLDCSASDKDKLQNTEVSSEDLQLKDKIERLSLRLTECRNENHILRCNLDLVEEIITSKEAGEESQDSQASEVDGKRGRGRGQDMILKLPTLIKRLQTQLKLLEEEKRPPDTPSEESVRKRLNAERKALWRMELERRQAREGVIREMNPITVECIEIRKTLDAEKARFRNLSRKVLLLQKQLQNRRYNSEENKTLLRSFREMENKISDTQTDICQLREQFLDSYPEVESRNDKYDEELSALRNQIKHIKEEMKHNSDALESLDRRRKDIEEVVDSEEWRLEQYARRYKNDLKKADDSFRDLTDIHDNIENLKREKSELARQFENLIESVHLHSKEDDQFSFSKFEQEFNKLAPSTSKEKTNENDAGDTKVQCKEMLGDFNSLQVEKLMIECAKYRALIEATSTESDILSFLTKIQKTHLREITRKADKTKRLLSKKFDEKKILLDKIPRTLNPLKRSNKEINIDLRVYIREQRDENEFFRAILKKIVESKIQDTHLCKTFLYDSKAFFENALQKMNDVSTVLSAKRSRESVKHIVKS